jgi:farnesyl-diphosphate farnesyltransferase
MTKTPPFGTGWGILPRVSRSFAMVIRWLPRPLDDAVMTAYLLCRIADTLEDSPLPADERRRLLSRFAGSLDSGRPEMPPAGASPAYACLTDKADEILACYRALPADARAVLRGAVTRMCEGMSKWCDREIATLADQNEYCWYVAGLVGLLLTDLFRLTGHVSERDAALLRPLAPDFGLALQKVNILRDLRSDLEERRCYWPTQILARHGLTPAALLLPQNLSRSLAAMRELVADQWSYLETALRYLTLLPLGEWRIRIFCAIPLFMAVATLRRCEDNAEVFLSPRPVKIPGRWVRGITMRALSLAPCNDYLRSWYRRWQRGVLDRPSPFSSLAALLP